ncbi:Lar family restriction alleviation protein [Pseudomonas alliivorans]|nr:Lar family restriction alleviation protein [Pseudomonas alliivorans]
MTTKPNSGTVSVSREILPCPFCGEQVKNPVSRPSSADGRDGFVAFLACYCGGYSATAHRVGSGDNERDAVREVIAKWNNRAQPADQQGEPVMKLEAEKLWGGDGEYAVNFVKPGWLKECREKGGTFLLYTQARPATAKVVLPERMPTGNITTPHHDLSPGVREGWNACLDEVAKLNGINT